MNRLTSDELIAFETEVAEHFNAAEIRAPVHLYSGNEEQMLQVFEGITDGDWIMCSWRSHYQCLLKGVPRERLMDDIVSGRSIALCYPEYRIVSSAIVGGILSIAVGTALGIKRRGGHERVHCFVGDMTAETGIFEESLKYSMNYDLPIRFIIEDNGMSVCTKTFGVWGQDRSSWSDPRMISACEGKLVYYAFDSSKYPHAGAGKRVQF